jgi:acetyl esterase
MNWLTTQEIGPWIKRLRVGAGAFVVDNAFRSLSTLGRLHPVARPARHRVEIVRDIPYRDSGLEAHRLDIYRPRDVSGPLPVVFYIHGGGFRILSKDTHWLMGLAFARRGMMVVSINYRLAPRHRYPAAIEDACAAFLWLVRHGAQYGADLQQLILAGESAGANLTTALAVTMAYRRPEPFAQAVFETGVQPVAVMPACGILQVSDPARFTRRRKLSPFIADRLEEVAEAYLGDVLYDGPGGAELADPLLLLERETPARTLPPFLAVVGTRDPLLDDTRRLKAALDRLGVPCRAVYYPGEVHAFHAMLWRANALACWREKYRFLDECLAPRAAATVASLTTPTPNARCGS